MSNDLELCRCGHYHGSYVKCHSCNCQYCVAQYTGPTYRERDPLWYVNLLVVLCFIALVVIGISQLEVTLDAINAMRP